MICFPNAKINLGLNIVAKRPDGYHNIETIFYPINLCDSLEIVPAQSKKRTFNQTGLQIEGNPSDNLVMKAYQMLEEKYPLPELDVYLLKKIPFGAGLGGGSSDAAFMLKLLNNFAKLNLTKKELEEISGKLGADCAFFIQNKPVFASGIGNIFETIDISLKGYYLSLVKPHIHISTQEAYAAVKPSYPIDSLKNIIQKPIMEWKNCMINDFESGIFLKYPEIQMIKEKLYDLGAEYASMSGSGSSVFGIFKSPIQKNIFNNADSFLIPL